MATQLIQIAGVASVPDEKIIKALNHQTWPPLLPTGGG